MSAQTLLDYVRLPSEITNFERDYLRRMNRVALGFFWLNLPLMVAVAFFNDTQPLLAVVLTLATLVGPSVAYSLLDNPRTVSLVHGFTAMCMGGLLVHFGQGPTQIEMHFYFFSLLAVLAMFGNPTVILVAAVTVTLHHTVIWALIPESVFNYDASLYVVAIHAAFVVVESVAACFIARSFFDNVIGLDKLVQARTAALAKRNEDLRLVFDNIQQGFVTAHRDGTLAGERSAVVDNWLVAGASTLQELVQPVSTEFAEWLDMGWEVLTDGFLPVEVALEQLPSRLTTGGRILDFSYQVVDVDDDGVQSVLIIITDATAEVARQETEAKQREFTSFFHSFLGDKVGFLEFFGDADELVHKLLTEEHHGNVALAKRWLHTLKGNSLLFGLSRFADLVHGVESEIVETGDVPSVAALEQLEMRWSELSRQLKDLTGEQDSGIELSEDEYTRLIAAIERNESRERLLGFIRAWKMEPATVRLRRLQDQARGIATRIDKSEVAIEIDTSDVRLHTPRFRAFWSSFVHILRNALDHGIESLEERQAAGKSGPGSVRMAATVDGADFVVQVTDDGRGINWDRVRKVATKRGLPSETQADLVAAMFADGLTTRTTVSLVSGRGVGLGVVRSAVDELGGRIDVDSESGRGTTFRFIFPLSGLGSAVYAAMPQGPRLQEPPLIEA